MNDAEVDAVHTQPLPVVTVIVDDPPIASTFRLVVDNVDEQDVGVLVTGGAAVGVVEGVVVLGADGAGVSCEQPANARRHTRAPTRGSVTDELTVEELYRIFPAAGRRDGFRLARSPRVGRVRMDRRRVAEHWFDHAPRRF